MAFRGAGTLTGKAAPTHTTNGDAYMTTADLVEHRLRQLEERQESQSGRLDAIVLQVDRVTVQSAELLKALAKFEGRLDERDKNFGESLRRLHERLDERLLSVAPATDVVAIRDVLTKMEKDDLRREGAKAERRRLWKFWFQVTGATTVVLGLAVAVIALFVN